MYSVVHNALDKLTTPVAQRIAPVVLLPHPAVTWDGHLFCRALKFFKENKTLDQHIMSCPKKEGVLQRQYNFESQIRIFFFLWSCAMFFLR